MEYQELDDEGIEPVVRRPEEGRNDDPSATKDEMARADEELRTEEDTDFSGAAAPHGNDEERTSVSQRQLAANRENAKRSTGPRTETGKQTSSKNAIKNGFYVDGAEPIRRGVLAEDPDELRDRIEGILASLQPRNEIQRELARAIASLCNTLRRITRYETLMLSADGKSIDSMLASSRVLLIRVARARLETVRHLVCEELRWDQVNGKELAEFLLDERNDGEPLHVEGVWDSEHRPQSEDEWSSAAELVLRKLFPKGPKQVLRWVDQHDFELSFEEERLEGRGEEDAARRAMAGTYTNTVPQDGHAAAAAVSLARGISRRSRAADS